MIEEYTTVLDELREFKNIFKEIYKCDDNQFEIKYVNKWIFLFENPSPTNINEAWIDIQNIGRILDGGYPRKIKSLISRIYEDTIAAVQKARRIESHDGRMDDYMGEKEEGK